MTTLYQRFILAFRIWYGGMPHHCSWSWAWLKAWRIAGECPQCSGAGQLWQHWGWDTYNFDAVDCKTCDGTGKRKLGTH